MFSFFKRNKGPEESRPSKIQAEPEVKEIKIGKPGTQEEYDKERERINTLRGRLLDVTIGMSDTERNLIKEKIKNTQQRLDELVAQGFEQTKASNHGFSTTNTQPRQNSSFPDTELPEVIDIKVGESNETVEELKVKEKELTEEIGALDKKLKGMRDEGVIVATDFSDLKARRVALDEELLRVQAILVSGNKQSA